MLWLFGKHMGVYLLGFFYSGIQFYLLLSTYFCFIPFLYLDLYVLRDDAWISEYDQEIPQSQTADNPVAPPGRAAQPSRDTRKTNSAKQPALSSPSR